MLAWQIRIGISINPRSVSVQHMQDALDALEAVDLLTDQDLLLLGTAPQIWCSVVPGNYQCAPDDDTVTVRFQLQSRVDQNTTERFPA